MDACLFTKMVAVGTVVTLPLTSAESQTPYCAPAVVYSSILSLRDLPPQLRNELTTHLADLVDRGEAFLATDVGRGPRRRFIMAVVADSRWVVAYEHGGIGYHIHVLTFDWPSQQESPLLSSNRMSGPNSFCEQINARLRNERIPADNANAPDWKY